MQQYETLLIKIPNNLNDLGKTISESVPPSYRLISVDRWNNQSVLLVMQAIN